MRRPIAAVVALGLLVAMAAGCAGGDEGAVSYRASDLRTGAPVDVDDLRGRPALLVSWATWCRECDEELAGLAAFARSEEAEGVEIVAVNLDAADVDAEIDAKLERSGLDAVLWRDRRNEFKRAFAALGVPTTVVLDADGRVAATFPGAVDFDDADVLAALDDVRSGS